LSNRAVLPYYIDQLYPECVCLQCLKDMKASFYKQGLDEIGWIGKILTDKLE